MLHSSLSVKDFWATGVAKLPTWLQLIRAHHLRSRKKTLSLSFIQKKGAQLSLPRCSSKASATAFRPFCCTCRMKPPGSNMSVGRWIWLVVTLLTGWNHHLYLDICEGQSTPGCCRRHPGVRSWFEPLEVSETLRGTRDGNIQALSLTSSGVGGFNLLGRL